MFSSTTFNYKKKHEFSYREAEAMRLKRQYPNSILVIVEMKDSDNKFIVPKEITMGQFSFLFRKKIKMGPEKALILLTYNGVICPTSELLGSLYNQYADSDQILYMYATEENVFG